MLTTLLKHPLVIILAAIILALGGLASLRLLPVDLFPRLDYPLINVITHYPAGTAEDMEQLVTGPVENAMLGLANLRRVRSVSAPGFSQVTVEFSWGIDVLQARQLVLSRVASARLPTGAKPELENIGTSLAMLSTYTLTGGNPMALRDWTQFQLAPRLASLPGVARVEVMGGAESAWRVDLEPLALRQHHLTMGEVATAIRQANVLATGGIMAEHGRDLLIRTEGRLRTIADLEQVVVGSSSQGLPVRLVDVAHIYAGAKPQHYVISANQLPAVVFTIQKQPGASTVTVSRAVDQLLSQSPLPNDVSLQKFYDQAEIIALSYRSMRDNLFMGALLAMVAVVWVLGRNKTSLAIAITFPLSVLATFWVMHLLGLGLNLMTLGALTVAIGMVADDAIIVLENINRHHDQGLPPGQAALHGTREILTADVAGTLTVLAAFAPLVLVGGLAGRLFHSFGLTFGTLLIFSLIFSVTIIPLAASRWLRPTPTSNYGIFSNTKAVALFSRFNLSVLDHLIPHKKLTILTVLLLMIASLLLLSQNQARMLPLLDENSLLISYQLAPGTSLPESNRVGAELEARVMALPEVAGVFRRTGSPESSFYMEGVDEGELVVRLAAGPGCDPLAVKAKLDAMIAAAPGVIGRVNEPTSEKLDESFSGLPALFGITLFGRDLAQLYGAASQVEKAATTVPGVTNVVNNTKIPVDQIRILLNRVALALHGVSARQVADTVRLAMQGETVAQVVIDQRPVDIFTRATGANASSRDDLGRIQVNNSNGQAIALDQLATLQSMASYPTIEHQHGLRALTLTAELDGNPLTITKELDQSLAALNLPAEIQWAYTGEYGELLRTSAQLFWVFLAASLLVYGIIAIQLGNLLDPAVVLVKLPLDFMGATLTLYITRQHLDLTVALGFITLIGVSTNNGIMLLTFIRHFRQQGLDALTAVRQAVTVRTRPMLLTHLTTLLALIPASLGVGKGPQLLQPLGIMLFGGLTVGTMLTLNFLPILYLATEPWRRLKGTQP